MDVVDFFKKFKIVESDCGESTCNGCVLENDVCGRFIGCPLPWGYVFKFREKGPKGNMNHG